VEFLKRPERFTAVGARIPKGCLLVGPPGKHRGSWGLSAHLQPAPACCLTRLPSVGLILGHSVPNPTCLQRSSLGLLMRGTTVLLANAPQPSLDTLAYVFCAPPNSLNLRAAYTTHTCRYW
jgi:hypothetical protein